MRAIMLICSVLVVYFVQGQNPSRRIYINPSIGFFRITNDNANINNSPLLIEGKLGIYVRKRSGIGLQFSRASQHAATSGISSLQPSGGGVVWTTFGNHKITATGIGIFYEHFYTLGNHVDFFPSVYAQYLHYTDEEKGHIVAGIDSSMTYARAILHNYIGRFGVNFNAQYTISNSLFVTARFGQIDCRVWNRYEQHVFFEIPLLVGVKYLFK